MAVEILLSNHFLLMGEEGWGVSCGTAELEVLLFGGEGRQPPLQRGSGCMSYPLILLLTGKGCPSAVLLFDAINVTCFCCSLVPEMPRRLQNNKDTIN